jgi:alpha-tubulin suppressor-like RCC1 family protein
MLDADPPGDCFGLLGGKPLLSRTKTIADVGDLRQVAAGDTFFMSISSSGGLYSWESSPSAASSSSSTAPPLGRACAIPERVPWFASPEKVNRVACGAQHAIVLASSGLYAWGANIYGQLGLGAHCSPADPHTLEPAPVKLPTDCSPALDVACGDTHSVVLTVAGQVLTFGCNWEGQLGIGESRYDGTLAATGCAHEPLLVHLPQGPEVSGDTRSYLITAGPQTTVAVSTNGQVFQWGKCVPDGIDGVCGRVSRWLPEELKAINHDATGSAPGPVWQSVTSADGLVVLARHAGLSGAAIGQQQHSSG